MRITRRWIAALTAALLISAVPVVSYGAVITDRTDSITSGSTYLLDEKGTEYSISEDGPGYMAAIEEVTKKDEFTGPVVKKVTLTERYHADYELYEEAMADMYFLYSNVGNGGVTHEPVYVDIPANIFYSMEKDGVPCAYTSRQKVSAKGTYVLRLMAVENLNLPLSEQTEYQSTFRFRIQDEPPVTEKETPSGTSVTQTPTTVGSLWENSNAVTYPVEGGLPSVDVDALKEEAKDAVKEAAKDAATEVVTDVVEDVKDNVQEGIDAVTDKAEEAIQAGQEALKETKVPREHIYERSLGKYITTLENGLEVVSTVPEGYIGPEAVTLMIAEGAATRAKLYRDDVEVEFISGNSQMEPGAYRLMLDDCAYSFTIAKSVSNMDVYQAPAEMRFTEVHLDDEKLELTSNQVLQMEKDGIYAIAMEGEEGQILNVTLKKDTEVPEVKVTVQGGTAAIQYVSDDIETVVLEKDGVVAEGFRGAAISEPGTYRLTVADGAGNTAAVDFDLNYQVNMYGILAIVLVILVIVALVVFILHTKKNMIIR